MFCMGRTVTIVLAALAFINPILAIEPDRDFSGKWIFDPSGSDTRAIAVPQDRFLTIVEQDAAIQCTSTRADGAAIEWTYDLNGSATRSVAGEESRNSKVKWEGNALLINTIVSGPKNY